VFAAFAALSLAVAGCRWLSLAVAVRSLRSLRSLAVAALSLRSG